jgi:ribosomal-protein-alanine N-acetyltransferase
VGADPIRIRLARLADAARIAALSRQYVESGLAPRWTPERVHREIRRADTVAITARSAATLAGFAIMNFGAERAHLGLLAVTPAYRRRGIGRRLLEWLEASAQTAGIAVVTLELRAGNDAARAFYHRLGYEEFASIARYYDRREAAIRMMHVLRYPSGIRSIWSPPHRLNDASADP